MDVAIGLKAHSGWAALVAVGRDGSGFEVVDRRRLELVEEAWAKQPYHAAEGLVVEAARERVAQGIAAAHRVSAHALGAAVARVRSQGHGVAVCAVVAGEPMPPWSVEQVLAVHIRMHRAEGALFREALLVAAQGCVPRALAIPGGRLDEEARQALVLTPAALAKLLAALGKAAGPPWGRDQKDAALAALTALGSGLPGTP